jgi:DNA-binding beta-propeller fold protein YncE
LNDSLILGKKWPNKISPVGIEIDDDRQLLYVVTKENNSFYILDIKTKAIVFEQNLGNEAYTCVLSPDKKILYI